jgi:hypothetical protein
VRSTCKWNTKPMYFGIGSEHEQCFLYTLAYLFALFQGEVLELGIIGGPQGCVHAAGP